jgi:hypothetical protein
MTALTTADYFDEMEHLKILDDIFNDAVKEKISEVVGLKIFDEKTKKRRNTTYEVGVGLTGVTAIAEGANYPEASGEEPNTLSLRKSKYGANVVVTEEMKIFDEYDQLEDRVRSIVDDALDKLDTTLAEILIYGFATTTYTNALGTSITPIGQEARALFNATDGNIITMPDGTAHPKLANTSVSAIRVQGAKHKNVLGQSKPIRYDYLLV